MSPRYGMKRTSVIALFSCASLWSACSEGAPVDGRDEDSAHAEDEEEVVNDEDQDDDVDVDEADAARPTRDDAGRARADAGEKPSELSDAGANPVDGSRDASGGGTPDASGPPATRDGGSYGSKSDSGAMGTPDASTPGPGAAQCTLKRYQPLEGRAVLEGHDLPVLEVNGGVTVRGVGCAQQWEGIVMTQGGRGLCTAAFISDRHLISASHCYASDGPVNVRVSAPTWDNGMNHTFQAQVKRSGSSMTLDVAIIDLGKPVEWAAAERRFVLHAGKAASADLHLYGFGSGGSSGAAGTLRGVPNRATIRVTDNGRGTLTGKAGPAQLCTGDSGGPAFVEKSAPVLFGINQAIVPSGTGGGRTCASSDWTIMFTNVSTYMPFVEQTLGKPCARTRVDDMDVAQCW
jgi:hypothetical protein